MADTYTQPPEDQSPFELTRDYIARMQQRFPNWKPNDGALEVGIGASIADEASTLYSMLRDDLDDVYRDFGQELLGVDPGDARAAETTTTWTLADSVGHTIPADARMVVQAPTQAVTFATLFETEIPAGQNSVSGVQVRAVVEGAAANGADGPVDLDEPPSWVTQVSFDEPASGGADQQSITEHRDEIATEIAQLSRVPILPEDFERLVKRIPGIDRALVLNAYDIDTNQVRDRCVSIIPLDSAGEGSPQSVRDAARDLVNSRREQNWVTRIGTPNDNNLAIAVTVATFDRTDDNGLSARVQAAIRFRLARSTFGVRTGAGLRTWDRKRIIRPYELEAVSAAVEGVEDVPALTINGSTDALTMTGNAPLPRITSITVTVVTATR